MALRRRGQSVGLDNFERGWITNSKLQHYIDDRGLRGVLSKFQSLQPAIEAKKYAIAEAQILWRSVGWCNLMLRIPATQILLPVIAQLICDRINVNTTLVFSETTYEQVGDAYLRGL
ncbi:transaldolase family protein [Microcoleus sp. AR_TQ3_B6]|uniref:transaldolase family protein n=1 Tax=Microcoleus sp. AR_TQ3_B6 TaxID=3055284 RepID=UPI002FD02EBF